jgi:hypothetical protein
MGLKLAKSLRLASERSDTQSAFTIFIIRENRLTQTGRSKHDLTLIAGGFRHGKCVRVRTRHLLIYRNLYIYIYCEYLALSCSVVPKFLVLSLQHMLRKQHSFDYETDAQVLNGFTKNIMTGANS